MPTNTSTNNWGTSQFIVSADPSVGTHTTIQSAINSAVSGQTIFVRDGTYTENITAKAGVNIAAYEGGNSVLNGSITYTDTGSVTINGLSLTSATNIVSITGANASVLAIENCDIEISSATGFSINNANAIFTVENCQVSVTGNFAVFALVDGTFNLQDTNVVGTAAVSLTSSTASGGFLNMNDTLFDTALTTSGTASFIIARSGFNPLTTFDQLLLDVNSTGPIQVAAYSTFSSNTQSPVNVSTNMVMISTTIICLGNPNCITGAGVLTYDPLTLVGGTIISPTSNILPKGQGAKFTGESIAGDITVSCTNQDQTSAASSSGFVATTGNGTAGLGDAYLQTVTGFGAPTSWGAGVSGVDGSFNIEDAFTGTFAGTGSIVIPPGNSAVGMQYGLSFNAGTTTLSSLPSSDGELIIGSTGVDPVISTLTAGTGINITNGAGSISISTPAITTVTAQVFGGNGTYTPTAGMQYCIVECVAGGGGGGGCSATTVGGSVGGGGGAGGYARGVFTAATIGVSQTVTIGTGGAGGVGFNPGAAGNPSSLGALISTSSGNGGTTQSNDTAGIILSASGGTGGSGLSGSFLTQGVSGGSGFVIVLAVIGGSGFSGFGGSCQLGGTAISQTSNGGSTVNGATSGNFGGGGSGAVSVTGGAAGNGGAGAAGVIIITEFI